MIGCFCYLFTLTIVCKVERGYYSQAGTIRGSKRRMINVSTKIHILNTNTGSGGSKIPSFSSSPPVRGKRRYVVSSMLDSSVISCPQNPPVWENDLTIKQSTHDPDFAVKKQHQKSINQLKNPHSLFAIMDISPIRKTGLHEYRTKGRTRISRLTLIIAHH